MIASGTGLLVRWFTRWDREAVTTLLAALAGQHGAQVQSEDLTRAFEYALRVPDEVRFCVAVRDGKVIGQASLHRAFSTWSARPCGTIEDVYILEQERRSGVATAIFDFLAAEARRRGYCRLRLDVQADNEPARAFYDRYGLHDTSYVVYELPVEESAP